MERYPVMNNTAQHRIVDSLDAREREGSGSANAHHLIALVALSVVNNRRSKLDAISPINVKNCGKTVEGCMRRNKRGLAIQSHQMRVGKQEKQE